MIPGHSTVRQVSRATAMSMRENLTSLESVPTTRKARCGANTKIDHALRNRSQTKTPPYVVWVDVVSCLGQQVHDGPVLIEEDKATKRRGHEHGPANQPSAESMASDHLLFDPDPPGKRKPHHQQRVLCVLLQTPAKRNVSWLVHDPPAGGQNHQSRRQVVHHL